MPKRLKRRFGKDNQRPIVQKYDPRYAERWDEIFNKKKEVDNENIKEDNQSDN
jgi:hypothetical protein